MGTQYQSFPDAHGASRSVAKLKALMLPCMDGKAFLDVGCNEGFFCAIAQAAGAARVVGIEAKAPVLERARRRFPGVEFRNQSWDDPIEGRFDVILFSSAIHYASDQPALIDKLVGLLHDGGVLVLELGIAQQDGDQYVGVQRNRGGVCQFATPGTLRRVLEPYDVREIGPSVMQRGDPVPRFVLHIRRRPAALRDVPLDSAGAAPLVLLFDAASRSGKSSTVRLLVQGAAGDNARSVSVDGLLNRVDASEVMRHPAHAAVLQVVAAFRAQRSTRTDLIMAMLAEQGLLDAFLAYAESVSGLGKAGVAIWDGFIPPEAREAVRLYFERRGYGVWNTAPRLRFQFPRVDVAALAATAAGSAQESELALLRLLQLPVLAGKSLAEIGTAPPLGAVARAAGACSARWVADAGALEGCHDVVVNAASQGYPTVPEVRSLLACLAPDGLLALVLPPAAARALPGAAAGRADEELERFVATLRRELPGVLVRKVTAGVAREAAARVVHLQNARPVLMLVDDLYPLESESLVRMLGAGTGAKPLIDAAALRACAAHAGTLPEAPLVVARGALAAAEREQVLHALEGAGLVVWEARRRTGWTFAALDTAAVLARAFPGASLEQPAAAPIAPARASRPVSLWRRLRRLARAAGKRLGIASPASAQSAVVTMPSAAVGLRPAAGDQAEAESGLEGALLDVMLLPGRLRLAGWAVDRRAGAAATDFVVEIEGKRIAAFSAAARARPKLVQRFGLAEDARPGFLIDLPLAELGGPERIRSLCAVPGKRPGWVRVGCRVPGAGSVHWLKKPAGLRAKRAGD